MNMDRREFLKFSGIFGAGAGLAGLGFNTAQVEAAAREFKLKDAKEYKSNCNFCSVGCGMICSVKDGKLINLEGDSDHIINEGALCPKGASMSTVPNSDQRVKTPLYRAPGSDQWQEMPWDEAIDKIARKMKQTRDENWIGTEKVEDKDFVVNRTDALGFIGGAQNNNEECYLMTKFTRLMGTVFVEHQARL